MKKIYTAIILGIILGNTVPAMASVNKCNRECTDEEAEGDVVNDVGDECTSFRYQPCTNGIIIADCKACGNGTKLVSKTEMIDGCSYTYSMCDCPDCTNCTSTDWTSAGGGVEQKVTASCDCGSCNKSTEYRCAAGYYGSGSSCSACPNGGDSVAGSTSITSCYISGSFSDSTGSGTYTGKCYYN